MIDHSYIIRVYSNMLYKKSIVTPITNRLKRTNPFSPGRKNSSFSPATHVLKTTVFKPI